MMDESRRSSLESGEVSMQAGTSHLADRRVGYTPRCTRRTAEAKRSDSGDGAVQEA
jgi:hypothetical protein